MPRCNTRSGPVACMEMRQTGLNPTTPMRSLRIFSTTPVVPKYKMTAHALDPSLYALSPEEAAFFKAATGIDDDAVLKAHILMVQEKAYKVAPYPCIYGFAFLKMGITQNIVYESILKIGRERKDAIFLDIGCCFSVDSRKAAADGFPACNIVASDLKQEFLELSHVLFNTSKDTYPGHFVAGDIFDPVVLSVAPPSRGVPHSPRPDLSALTSLNPLRGYCSVINASTFFHLFAEEKQLHVARALAGLLSSEPGSLTCGMHVGREEAGILPASVFGSNVDMFCHSPQSWKAMWDGVFTKGEVKVEASLSATEPNTNRQIHILTWSVTRL
ncbi:hypothetical protein BU15DRAFT_87747 [Melanogaster broomeanus]|nr:hypothetical protein BU15DRAFT_87747 [Melanogaster broomeanus]